MPLHSSHLTLSFEPSTTLHHDAVHDTLHTTSIPVSACRSGLNPIGLGDRMKNRLRGVLQLPGLSPGSPERPQESMPKLDDEKAFSPIGASSGVRLSLTQTPPDAVPSTVMWALPQPGWGQWPSHSFSYCISVLTERDARATYVVSAPSLPPVYECTMDGVEHLWLVVPSRPSAGGQMQLTEDQMRAAVKFCERAGPATPDEEDADADSCGSEGDDAGYCVEACEEGAVLLSCAEGNEVDAVALAVLLLAHQSRGYDYWRVRGEQDGPNGPAYRASRLVDDDPGVSYVWKGLLGWQDVERVQAALW